MVLFLFGKTFDVKLGEQVFQQRAMQVVEVGPWHVALSHLVHGRRIAGPPSIGKASPIDGDAFGFFPGPAFFDDRSAPVDHCAKCVKDERFHGSRSGRRILRACAIDPTQGGGCSTDPGGLHDLSPSHLQARVHKSVSFRDEGGCGT
jgi:hypothetical protein